MGHPFTISDKEKFGFFFTYESRGVDLETIYQMGQKLSGIKQNVLKREFLIDGSLFLYTSQEIIARAFAAPHFQMILGRSGDLASVREIKQLASVM
jgi:CRISPR-associated protein Cas5t